MHHKSKIIFFTLLLVRNCYSMDNANQEPQQSTSIFSRLWSSIFGSSESKKEECATCKTPNSGGSRHIENAILLNGTGQSSNGTGSPTTIGNLYGNPNNNVSEATLLALKKEETRQIELANAQELQKEYERNKWLNALVRYWDERTTELSKNKEDDKSDEVNKKLVEEANKLLDKHHKTLKELEKERGVVELEKERMRHQNYMERSQIDHKHFMDKLTYVGNGVYLFLADKERVKIATFGLSAAALGFYLSKRSTKVAADYVRSILMKPNLVTETSRKNVGQFFKHPVNSLFKRHTPLPSVIYNPELQSYVDKYVASIKAGKKDSQPFRHALFYGAPGTGKTLLAKTIAKSLGMNYAIINSANIHQFENGQGVEELNKLFDWAKRSRKGTVLFFDECDALAPKRNGLTSEQMRKIQNTLYSLTGTETNDFLMLGATNAQELLDPAFLSRMDIRIEFPLPDQNTRVKLLQLYFKIYVNGNKNIKTEDNIEALFEWIAEKIKDYSGREISQLVRSFVSEAYSTEDKTVTEAVIVSVVEKSLEQRKKLNNSSLNTL